MANTTEISREQQQSDRQMRIDPARLERAWEVVEHFVQEEGIPGAVCAVGQRDELYGPRAYGWASLVPERKPMQPGTIFDLASVTKVIATTTAMMMLIERGLVRLDDPACRFVPQFPHKEVRIRHLLTHSSGLPAWHGLYEGGGGRERALQRLFALSLEQQPGEKVVYSCMGFILLGIIVERVASERLDVLTRTEVFEPLGMSQTTYLPSEPERSHVAATEYDPKRKGPLQGVVHDENARLGMDGVSGNAGLFAPAADVARFCQMLVAEGELPGAPRLLAPATVRLMRECHTDGLNEARGLGWVVKGDDPYSSAGDLLSPASYGHTGFTGTSIWIDPVSKLYAILLTNRVHPTRDNSAHIRLRALFHNAAASALVP